jgi:hypothetical protein
MPKVTMLRSAGHASATDEATTEVTTTEVSPAEVSPAHPATDVTSATPDVASAAAVPAATATCEGVGRENAAAQRRGDDDNSDSLHHGFLRFLHVS